MWGTSGETAQHVRNHGGVTTHTEHLDVLIVGAGLSGIGAAVHLKKAVPRKTYAILEAREASGRTPTCTRWATRSAPGRARRRSPTARRSSSTSATPPATRASTGTSATA